MALQLAANAAAPSLLQRGAEPMSSLIAAALVFLGIHVLISGTRIRDVITGAIGEKPYLGLFSLASLATIIWLASSYNAASADPGNRVLYDLGIGVRHLAIPLLAIAFLLGVQGLLAPNPTSVQQERAAASEGTVKGVLRITRHPFLWGVILWAAIHLAINGDLASVIFFGTFLLVALLGTRLIDAKRKRRLGQVWDKFAYRTSNIPFSAALSGRNKLKIGESFSTRFWVALATFVIVLFVHAWLFGASPFPGGWVPF
jgi:uncharacterized membrane protein